MDHHQGFSDFVLTSHSSQAFDSQRVRSGCIKACRKLTRIRSNNNVPDATKVQLLDGLSAQRRLVNLIQLAKNQAWEALVAELDPNIWGQAYQMVRKKLKTHSPHNQRLRTAMALFLACSKTSWRRQTTFAEEIRSFNESDLQEALKRMNVVKAPDPDRIPVTVVGRAVSHEGNARLDILNKICTECLYCNMEDWQARSA